MKIYVGTSGYAYNEWKGKFYPEKISSKEMLGFYSKHLSAVEINNTFYHTPTESVLRSWADQVPDDFVFAIKAPQVITHMKRLQSVESETEYLFRTLAVLGGKLGPVLFQFPASFRADRAALESFLILIPHDFLCAFEFRSKSWFDESILYILRKRDFSLCISDTDDSPAEEIISTSKWGYLRLRRTDYQDADLKRWQKTLASQNWLKAFVFFKHEEADAPEMARRFRERSSLR